MPHNKTKKGQVTIVGGRNSANPSKGQRLDTMARKRDERAARAAYRKEKKAQSYLADDNNFQSFSGQLSKLGLQLRDIPGDGNCLFRALGDQMEGHGRDHFKHRYEIVQYMVENKEDFEPFIEDDIPFEAYVNNLKKIGTYAGNDAIVAFARLHKVNIVIHQLGSPVWTVSGTDDPNARELHISYHNGDHYSSVRRLADNTESPANIKLKFVNNEGDTANHKTKKSPKDYSHMNGKPTGSSSYNGYYDNLSDYDNVDNEDIADMLGHTSQCDSVEGVATAVRLAEDVEEQVMKLTGCKDTKLVTSILEENWYDVDATVATLLSVMTPEVGADDDTSLSSHNTTDSGIWSDNGSGTRIFGSQASSNLQNGSRNNSSGARPKQKPLTAKQKKFEKKRRAEERRRLQFLGQDPYNSSLYNDDVDEEETTVVAEELGILKI